MYVTLNWCIETKPGTGVQKPNRIVWNWCSYR